MSDHDFEKQVQQKMEQLRLRPSDAVWTTVDKRIRKERRRRRVILWVPLFLLCVVAGGYFYFNTSSDNNKFTASELNSTQHSNTNSNNHSNASEPTPSADNSSSNATVTEPATTAPVNDQAAPSVTTENSIEPSAPKVAPAQTPAAEAASAEKTITKPAVKPSVKPADKPASTPASTNNAAQPKNDLTVTTVKNKTNGRNLKGKKPVVIVGADQADFVATENPAGVKRKTKVSLKKNNDQPVSNQVAGKNPVQTDVAQSDSASASLVNNNTELQKNIDAGNVAEQPKNTDSLSIVPVIAKANPKKKPAPVAAPIKKKKQSSWSYGIVAEGGASHISKGSPFSLLSKKNNEPEDLAQSSPVSSNQTLLGNPAGFAQIPEKKPSDLKSSLAWSAGGFVQKQLTKRISVSAGVQYSYFSMKTDVGEYMKSAINVTNANYDQVVSGWYQGRSAYAIGGGFANYSYPRPPEEHEYTNKYHFLEIPLKIHWRVTGDEAALPIIVDGGLSVAKLISTNALHYDGANDVYYKDYDYFNKIQAGISAGVNVALFNQSKHPVWIGPSIKYQLSNLITSDLSSGQHLWSFGLGAKFFLRK